MLDLRLRFFIRSLRLHHNMIYLFKKHTFECTHTILYYNTVEPLSNDHPHQRPSLLYDHILCDGQCFLFVRSLTDDNPSDATHDRVRWDFLPRERPPISPSTRGVYSVFPRIGGGGSTSVPNHVLLQCCA